MDNTIGQKVAVLPREKISRLDVELYKREMLEQSVLVSPKESAKILNCSERKVYDLVKHGRLSGYNERRGTRGLKLLASELCSYVKSIKIESDAFRE